ncbi:MAG: ABC transporter ATP-binding protein [Halobacteriales archaeon]
MAPIEVDGLTKRYGDVLANDGLSFEVAEGEVFGYLGPNGAGKTTTIRTLMAFQSPTSGTARVLGADVRDERAHVETRRHVGYLPESPAFDESATGREVLDLHARVKGDDRRGELLELFSPPLDRPIREYSTGNVQMLGLVQAFMHDPDLVVMDEPTSGLDPLKVQQFNEFLRGEQDAGTTVFMSSHQLGEVRRVCDRVGIIRDAELVTTEGVDDLLGRSGKFVRLRAAGDVDVADFELAGTHDLEVRSGDGDVTEVTFTYTGEVDPLVDRLGEYELLDLDVEEAPLDEVFMRFYGGHDV